ncbi:MAG: hypothetical protein HZB92_01595 [Euryarchaeota archaeon]|nr:hypothetical protein [Euryarchaeota archaeon]
MAKRKAKVEPPVKKPRMKYIVAAVIVAVAVVTAALGYYFFYVNRDTTQYLTMKDYVRMRANNYTGHRPGDYFTVRDKVADIKQHLTDVAIVFESVNETFPFFGPLEGVKAGDTVQMTYHIVEIVYDNGTKGLDLYELYDQYGEKTYTPLTSIIRKV